MIKENLPLKLLNRNAAELDLKNPLYIEDEKALFEKRDKLAESAVIFLPKSKALIHMTLSLASDIIVEGGKVILAGTNDAGIRSAKEIFEKNIGPVEQKIVGNHSALYIGANKRPYAGKTLGDFRSFFNLIYKDVIIEIADVPGVFSAGSLDAGTKTLLDTIPYDKKKILDIGCGAGIIGSVYKKKNPQSDVTMADSSHIAIYATNETLRKNKLEATVIQSDVFSNIVGSFDLILANPPFHTGIATDYSFIESFARSAKKHLNPGGEIYVVANTFLSYKEILERNIGPTEIVVDDKKFKVFKSRA